MRSKFIIKSSLILILLSMGVSFIYAHSNIKNYDKNVIKQNELPDKLQPKIHHMMIKNDVLRYFSHGDEIKNQLKENSNYFETGRNNFTKYLFPRIIAYYYLITNESLYQDIEKKYVKIGAHQNFLFFQVLLYYLSVCFLYYQIRDKINKEVLFFTLLFLCLEPTIFQYHGSFWSESIFFSLQVLIIGLALNHKSSIYRLFILGILLSFLAFQRSNGLYYIVPVVAYLFFVKEFNFFKKIIFVFFGFIILLNIIGYHNYKKSGKFFIIPIETKSVLHTYVLPEILESDEFEKEKKVTLDLIQSKKIEIDISKLNNAEYSRYSFLFCEDFDLNKSLDYLSICEHLNNRAKEIILDNPYKSIKFLIRNSLSFSLLNPFHIYSDHIFFSGKLYYQSDLHQDLRIYRIIYSILIYSVCFIGLIHLIKTKNIKLLFFIIISSLYFFSILSWHGNNRYFTPILIYFSFLFGNGVYSMKDIFLKKTKKI